MLFGGTLINVLSVVTGSIIGILIGRRIPRRIHDGVFQALGLFTAVLGVSMAIKGQMLLIIVFSLLIGTVVGEMFSIEKRMEDFSGSLTGFFKIKNPKILEGMITAFLLYCMGSMTIVGAIDEGLGNGSEVLYAKSMMDGFSSIALASVFGFGVILSVIPLLLFQGSITLLAFLMGDIMVSEIITELTAVSGILLVGLGINILDIKKIRVMNMLPYGRNF